jgi:hypothetical protein
MSFTMGQSSSYGSLYECREEKVLTNPADHLISGPLAILCAPRNLAAIFLDSTSRRQKRKESQVSGGNHAGTIITRIDLPVLDNLSFSDP